MSAGAAVLEIVREHCGAAVSPEVAFEDLKIDSLEFIEIVSQVEQAFDIKIKNDTIPKIITVRDLIDEALRVQPSN